MTTSSKGKWKSDLKASVSCSSISGCKSEDKNGVRTLPFVSRLIHCSLFMTRKQVDGSQECCHIPKPRDKTAYQKSMDIGYGHTISIHNKRAMAL